MSRRSLRPQLNQVRIWVHQGRTDAWIAHQLEVSASELREFRRQHDLSAENASESTSAVDLRDEIEAEIEAATEEEARAKAQAEEDAAVAAAARGESDDTGGDDTSGDEDAEDDGSEAEGRPRRRGRGRGRRGNRGRRNQIEGTFDHGEEGFGLWLDPAIQDIQNYSEHWAGERNVTVTVEQDQIVIRRAGGEDSDGN